MATTSIVFYYHVLFGAIVVVSVEFVPGAASAKTAAEDLTTHVGIVWEVASDGLAILFTGGLGFCDELNIPRGIDWQFLARETRVEVCLNGSSARYQPSLTLLCVLGPRFETAGPGEAAAHGQQKDITLPMERKIGPPAFNRPVQGDYRIRPGARSGSNGVLIGDNLNYNRSIKAALDEGATAINTLGTDKASMLDPCRNGYTAEADHVATFNVDAAATRSGARATRLDSNGKKSADIQVTDSSGKVINEVSSKVCKNPSHSTGRQRGYGEQDRLVPSDQLDQITEMAVAKAKKEASRPEALHQEEAAEYAKVAEKATDRVKGGSNESDPRTYQESQDLGDKAKDGNVITADITGPTMKRIRQGASQGAKLGAIGGAAVSGVVEGYSAIRGYNRGEKTAGEAAGDFAIGVTKGTLEGAVKGAAAGAATAAARVAAERVSGTALKSVLGGAGPAAAAVCTVEIAVAAVQHARGLTSGTEFRNTVVGSVGGAVGGVVGATVGSAGGPIGMLIGGFVGSLIGSKAGSWFTSPSNGSALSEDVDAALLPGPQFDGALQYRLAQLGLLLEALDQRDSLVFPERVLRTPNGYQLTADLMLAHRGTIWAVDFKAWKGVLSLSDNGETQGNEPRWLLKTRIDKRGMPVVQRIRNPIQDLRRFATAARNRMAQVDSRWRTYDVKPVVVFPNECSKAGIMEHDARFVPLREFLRMLTIYGDGCTSDWMPDGLISVPTWDMIQGRNGAVQQGLLDGGFDMKLADGSTHIPYEAIIKLEIGERAGDYRWAKATFRQEEVLSALLPKQTILLDRKGYPSTFDLHDLGLVVPTNMLMTI